MSSNPYKEALLGQQQKLPKASFQNLSLTEAMETNDDDITIATDDNDAAVIDTNVDDEEAKGKRYEYKPCINDFSALERL